MGCADHRHRNGRARTPRILSQTTSRIVPNEPHKDRTAWADSGSGTAATGWRSGSSSPVTLFVRTVLAGRKHVMPQNFNRLPHAPLGVVSGDGYPPQAKPA